MEVHAEEPTEGPRPVTLHRRLAQDVQHSRGVQRGEGESLVLDLLDLVRAPLEGQRHLQLVLDQPPPRVARRREPLHLEVHELLVFVDREGVLQSQAVHARLGGHLASARALLERLLLRRLLCRASMETLLQARLGGRDEDEHLAPLLGVVLLLRDDLEHDRGVVGHVDVGDATTLAHVQRFVVGVQADLAQGHHLYGPLLHSAGKGEDVAEAQLVVHLQDPLLEARGARVEEHR
mmetsp:Transcript_147383/g.455936  ORF Transcript_147383/g.455936 Transcript_147383/m.455936 type:complete len:235 (+) Transcript_147383:727-1431(+)